MAAVTLGQRRDQDGRAKAAWALRFVRPEPSSAGRFRNETSYDLDHRRFARHSFRAAQAMKATLLIASVIALLGCDSAPSAAPSSASGAASGNGAKSPQKIEAARAPRTGANKTVVDVALESKDHSTLVAALQAAGLVESLDSPGGAYTIFAPTNAAFDKLPKGSVEGLLKPEKLADLKSILQHHAAVPVRQAKDFKDGETMGMADGTTVTIHVKDGKVMVNDANIVASVSAMNGVVHVVDAVLLPTPR